MAQLIVFGGSGSEEITDGEIDYLLCLENRIQSTLELRDALADNFIARLKSGAQVEPGPHAARLETAEDNGVTEERLLIDNVCRYKRVIGSATKVRSRAFS